MSQTIIIAIVILHFLSFSCSQNTSLSETNCISTYQDLKTSLRSNRTHNVQRMLDVFYPPNTAPSHVVFVMYCVRSDYVFDSDVGSIRSEESCNSTFTNFEFQWLTNTIPLLIDSDVFQANTFNFADLLQMNLSLTIDPFCDDVDGAAMLETLTVWVSHLCTTLNMMCTHDFCMHVCIIVNYHIFIIMFTMTVKIVCSR